MVKKRSDKPSRRYYEIIHELREYGNFTILDNLSNCNTNEIKYFESIKKIQHHFEINEKGKLKLKTRYFEKLLKKFYDLKKTKQGSSTLINLCETNFLTSQQKEKFQNMRKKRNQALYQALIETSKKNHIDSKKRKQKISKRNKNSRPDFIDPRGGKAKNKGKYNPPISM